MVKKRNVYMYPMCDKTVLQRKHPYIDSLTKSFMPFANILNWGKQSKAGVLGMVPYTFSMDTLYLNWIEDLPNRKAGTLQAFLFMAYCFVLKMLGKKIVWTHHNKSTHTGSSHMNARLTRFLNRHADTIVMHSRESIELLQKTEEDNNHFYFFHPFESSPAMANSAGNSQEYDLLIWGNMRQSKGVEAFLDFLKTTDRLRLLKINIVGRFDNEHTFRSLWKAYHSEYINIENRFIENDELQALHSRAKLVFFPYTGASVLNSGALVRSLTLGTAIIGPPTGAFNDLYHEGLIDVYPSFEYVIQKAMGPVTAPPTDKISKFVQHHTWDEFARQLLPHI